MVRLARSADCYLLYLYLFVFFNVYIPLQSALVTLRRRTVKYATKGADSARVMEVSGEWTRGMHL